MRSGFACRECGVELEIEIREVEVDPTTFKDTGETKPIAFASCSPCMRTYAGDTIAEALSSIAETSRAFVVGQIFSHANPNSWAWRGIYRSELEAIQHCETDLFFVGPVNIDEVPPDEVMEWPGVYWPRALHDGGNPGETV